MAAIRLFQLSAAVLGLACGATVVSAKQTPEIDAALRARLLQLKQVQPNATPKPPLETTPTVSKTPSDGVIARLGDSRLRHAAKPLCVTFSPDGKRLFSGGEDGMLRVWNTTTGESVKVRHTPDTSVQHLEFTHGGTQLAVQFADNRVLFLNPETLQEISRFSAQFGSGCAISNNNRFVAHFGGNGLLRVTELSTKLEQLEVPVGSPYQFHPNNKSIAVADPKGVVTLYLLAGGKPVMTFDNGDKLTSLAFSPDGKRAACGVGGVTKVWDIDGKTAKVVAEVKEASRVGNWLDNNRLTLGGAESAGVYDLAEKKWVGRAQGVAGEWAISPDGSRLAATGAGGLRIRIWDLATGMQLHAENDSFPESALLAPTADGKAVFVVAGENAFLWPLTKPTASVAGKLPGKALLAASAKERLAVATAEGVLVYDNFDPTQPLAAKASRTLVENAAGCRALAVSLDGKSVAYSGEAAKVVVADAATGKTLRTLPVQTIAIALAFNPDGDKLATVGRDGFLRLSATTGDEADLWKVRVQRGQRGSVAFSADGKYIAATSSGLIKVVNASDGTEVFAVGGLFENGLFQQVAFSTDNRYLIAASEGMTGGVRVWDVSTQSLVRQFTTGFGTVYRLGVFSDGTRLVSAGAEEAITVWDLTGRHGKEAPKAELPKR